jgi:hypothetical protein
MAIKMLTTAAIHRFLCIWLLHLGVASSTEVRPPVHRLKMEMRRQDTSAGGGVGRLGGGSKRAPQPANKY